MRNIETHLLFFYYLLINVCAFNFNYTRVNDFNEEKSDRYYDKEEIHLDMPDIVRKHGYPCEEHTVITEDGYILTLHRIPYGKRNAPAKKTPVLLVPGMCQSSTVFIVGGPQNSLPFILADEGYDVWLANARGTYYSRRHISLNPDVQTKYWHFSWDEIGNYDVPASIDHILYITGKSQLHYIGHSQGGMTLFILEALRPEYNSKISTAYLLGSNIFYEHVRGFWKLIEMFKNVITNNARRLNIAEVFPRRNTLADRKWNKKCSVIGAYTFLCIVSDLVKRFTLQKADERVKTFLKGHTPAGCSFKQFLHYGQLLNGKTTRFDYGSQNRQVYGTPAPPRYDLSRVTTPFYVFFSTGDGTYTKQDYYKLITTMKSCRGSYLIDRTDFGHYDYIVSKYSKLLIYDKILNAMMKADYDFVT